MRLRPEPVTSDLSGDEEDDRADTSHLYFPVFHLFVKMLIVVFGVMMLYLC